MTGPERRFQSFGESATNLPQPGSPVAGPARSLGRIAGLLLSPQAGEEPHRPLRPRRRARRHHQPAPPPARPPSRPALTGRSPPCCRPLSPEATAGNCRAPATARPGPSGGYAAESSGPSKQGSRPQPRGACWEDPAARPALAADQALSRGLACWAGRIPRPSAWAAR